MIMKLFGTDGIRGNASEFPFKNNILAIIGKSIAEVLCTSDKREILIIRDTRESGKRIQKYLSYGIADAGADTVFGGIMPTPAASVLMRSGKFSAAIVISASHNPYMDNGIKIFNSKGTKLSDSLENKIEKKIKSYINKDIKIKSKKSSLKEDSTLIKIYENFILESFGKGSLKGKTIVVDCANGASYKSAVDVLKKLGAKLIILNNKPDGKNINLNSGALHPEIAAEAVKKNKAFCGFAFDGDADRLICIDETGTVRDGDFFLAAMARYMKKKKKLKNNILVTTIMANLGLVEAMKREKIKTVMSKVGDRYVLEDMIKYKASLGGEQSGHFIFRDILGTGDGLLSAIQILAAINNENKVFSEFFQGIEKLPQILINKKVPEKKPLEQLPDSLKLIRSYEEKLGNDGRVNVRYSGTEKLLRVMVEGKNLSEIKKIAKHISENVYNEIIGKKI